MRPRIFVLLGSIAFGGSGFPSSAGATPASALLQVVSITGVVRDTSGVPLPNAQVIIPALNRGTTTNGNGEFTFRAIPAGTYHLISQMIGYAPGHADATVPLGSGAPVRVTITARPTPLTLTSVQITATPTGTDPRELTQSTVAVADQALARSLSTTVAQSLANEPGISASFNGPAAAMPVIRGLTGERVLVLHDGQRASDLSATSPDHAVSVDPLTAERIEVVRGPASLLYGNNALGGVVNVISNDIPTEVPSHVEGYFAGQAESATPGGGVSAGLTVPVGARMALVARGGGRNVGDLRQGDQLRLPNTALRNWYGTAGLGVVGDQMTGGILYRPTDSTTGFPRRTTRASRSKVGEMRSVDVVTSASRDRASRHYVLAEPRSGTRMMRSRLPARSERTSAFARRHWTFSAARKSAAYPVRSVFRDCSSNTRQPAKRR